MKDLKNPHGYVYRIINKIDGRTYIGQRMLKYDKSWRFYLGSGTLIVRDVKELGADNFIKQLVTYCYSMEELDEVEKSLIISERKNGKAEYNLTISTKNGYKYLSSDDRKKIKAKAEDSLNEKYGNIFLNLGEEIIISYEKNQNMKIVSKLFDLPRERLRQFLVDSNVALNVQNKIGTTMSKDRRQAISKGYNKHLSTVCKRISCKTKVEANKEYCSIVCEQQVANQSSLSKSKNRSTFFLECPECLKYFETIRRQQKCCSRVCANKFRFKNQAA